MKPTLMMSTLAIALPAPPASYSRQIPNPPKKRLRYKNRRKRQIYGSQLMTRKERAEHRAKMRAAKTAEEREQSAWNNMSA